MAREYAATAGYRSDFGDVSGRNNLSACTVMLWENPDSEDQNGHLLYGGSGGTGWLIFRRTSAASGYLVFQRDCTTTDAVIDTQQNNLQNVAANQWNFLAVVWDLGVTGKLYTGDRTNPPAEPSSYGTQDLGSGSSVSGSGQGNLWVGSRNDGSLVHDGEIAWVHIVNRALTENEIRAQWLKPHLVNGSVLYTHLGIDASTNEPDWSPLATDGTTTSATRTDHPSTIPSLYGHWRRSIQVPAAAPTGQPTMMRWQDVKHMHQITGRRAF